MTCTQNISSLTLRALSDCEGFVLFSHAHHSPRINSVSRITYCTYLICFDLPLGHFDFDQSVVYGRHSGLPALVEVCQVCFQLVCFFSGCCLFGNVRSCPVQILQVALMVREIFREILKIIKFIFNLCQVSGSCLLYVFFVTDPPTHLFAISRKYDTLTILDSP